MAGVLAQEITDRWAIYNADCMDVMAGMPGESIDASIYSPPFAGLYQYSSSDRDLSNSRSQGEFFEHYGMVVEELFRLTRAGRLTGVHAAPIPSSNTGVDSYQDFPGDVIRVHQAAGWQWVARHVIWKEPLAVRNRTMAKNLAHRTVCEHAEHAGVAAADELLIFRKPGVGVPVTHPTGFHGYAGSLPIPPELERYRDWDGDQKLNKWSHMIWRRYASSIWDDVRSSRVLPFRDSKDPDDERHVHPLQLDVIARFVDMRTNPGDTVLTPFMGVGSEVFETVRMGRRGIGVELKPTYYRQALLNLAHVDDDREPEPPTLLDALEDMGVS
jgi:hypothetical protein